MDNQNVLTRIPNKKMRDVCTQQWCAMNHLVCPSIANSLWDYAGNVVFSMLVAATIVSMVSWIGSITPFLLLEDHFGPIRDTSTPYSWARSICFIRKESSESEKENISRMHHTGSIWFFAKNSIAIIQE